MTEVINGRLRMLGGRVLLRPLEWDASKIIIAIRHGRPVRGEVVAVGPGYNPMKYKTGPKGPRTLMDYSRFFQPTQVKPGEIVELGGLNIFDGAGYQFTDVLLNGVFHLICHEKDICFIRDDCVSQPFEPWSEAAELLQIELDRQTLSGYQGHV